MCQRITDFAKIKPVWFQYNSSLENYREWGYYYCFSLLKIKGIRNFWKRIKISNLFLEISCFHGYQHLPLFQYPPLPSPYLQSCTPVSTYFNKWLLMYSRCFQTTEIKAWVMYHYMGINLYLKIFLRDSNIQRKFKEHWKSDSQNYCPQNKSLTLLKSLLQMLKTGHIADFLYLNLLFHKKYH